MGGGGSVPLSEGKALSNAAISGADSVKAQEEMVLAAFKRWDTDGNGSISLDELNVICKSMGMKEDKVKLLMKEADTNQDGDLSYEELVAWLFQAPFLKKMFGVLETALFKAEEDWLAVNLRRKAATSSAERSQCKNEMSYVEEELVKKVQKECKTFLKESFKWHDKNSNGVLSKQESITFFTNYVSLFSKFAENAIKKGRALNPEFKGKIMTEADLQKHMDAYLKNVDKHHNEAFQIIDAKSAGTLSEDGVLNSCIPGSSQNAKFMRAIWKIDDVKVPMNVWHCLFPILT